MKLQYITAIVEAMVKHGFMSGWFGDESEQFIKESVDVLMSYNSDQLLNWLSDSEFNICHYCGQRENFNHLLALL